MNSIYKLKFVLPVSLKNLVQLQYAGFHRANYRLFASAKTEWIDLEAVCRTGKIPKTFNFARDVFEKHVVERPTDIALWFDNDNIERKWNFAELKTESIRAAVALQNVLKSSTTSSSTPYILTILPRVPEWWYLNLAAIRIGAVFCPGTTMLTTQDIQYRLEASRAKIVITDEQNMSKIDEAVKNLGNPESLKKIVVTTTKHNNNWLNYNHLVNKVDSNQISNFKDADMDSESIAQIYFTSGTTGKPKMVAHSQVSYGIGHYKTQRLLGPLQHNDVNWCISDTGWAKSAYSNFFAPWIAGCTVYIHQMERFEAQRELEVLHTKPITTFCAPPTMYKSLIQISNDKLFNLHSVRKCIGGGEAVNPEVAKVWKQKTGIKLHELYGQTEHSVFFVRV